VRLASNDAEEQPRRPRHGPCPNGTLGLAAASSDCRGGGRTNQAEGGPSMGGGGARLGQVANARRTAERASVGHHRSGTSGRSVGVDGPVWADGPKGASMSARRQPGRLSSRRRLRRCSARRSMALEEGVMRFEVPRRRGFGEDLAVEAARRRCWRGSIRGVRRVPETSTEAGGARHVGPATPNPRHSPRACDRDDGFTGCYPSHAVPRR